MYYFVKGSIVHACRNVAIHRNSMYCYISAYMHNTSFHNVIQRNVAMLQNTEM